MHHSSFGNERSPSRSTRDSWLWSGAAAGIFGIFGTLVGDIHLPGDGTAGGIVTMDMIDGVNQQRAHLSIVTGFIAVALLLVFAAAWRRHMESRHPESTAMHLVPLALSAAAGALTLGYGWKGATAIYHAEGMDAGTYDDLGLFVYYILNDFGSFIGWFGVTIAAGACVWLSFRERLLPIWLGIFSCLPVLAVVGFTGGTGLPGFPGVVSPLWLTIACTGLALQRELSARGAAIQPQTTPLTTT